MKENIAKFKAGKTYTHRWLNTGSISEVTVEKRTSKFVTIFYNNNPDEKVRCKITIFEGSEQCYPCGKYSMAPTLLAENLNF